jgi:hypothetical protein
MLALVVFPVLLAAAPNDLVAAQKAYADVEYARCRDKARAALLLPAARNERVDAYRLLGLCSAAEADSDAARDAFQLMLAIDKDARLPDGLSPRFTSSFREAKGSWVDVVPLALSIENDVVGEGGRTLRVRVQDAADLVEKVAWRSEGGVLSRPLKRADVLELSVPANAAVTVVALDAHGGEVALLELLAKRADDGGGALDDKPQAKVAEDAPFPWLAVGSVVGGVVIVGVGVGVGVAVLSAPPHVTLVPSVAFAE